jgi:CRP/FNR family transcriptional regulator, anaerobic regulatory protein
VNLVTDAVETLFPDLACSDDVVVAQVIRSARRISLPPGATVFRQGSACEQYLLVIDGNVRVQMLTDGGHEVVLYHVRPGESCMLTTSCLLGGVPYPADGVTETSLSALAIETGEFRRALGESAGFRTFVFRNIGERFAEVIGRLSDVAFGSIDRRLATALLREHQSRQPVALTHQALAVELGTAREVVSRHLKRFEQQGWVSLGRSQIDLLDPAALSRLSGPTDLLDL